MPAGAVVSASGGPGAGGATLSPPPVPAGRVLRGVAFSPAVRGYPGGIADMAAEQGDLTDGDEPDGGTAWTAAPAAAAGGGLGQLAAQPAAGTSVWQQSIAVWREAGHRLASGGAPRARQESCPRAEPGGPGRRRSRPSAHRAHSGRARVRRAPPGWAGREGGGGRAARRTWPARLRPQPRGPVPRSKRQRKPVPLSPGPHNQGPRSPGPRSPAPRRPAPRWTKT